MVDKYSQTHNIITKEKSTWASSCSRDNATQSKTKKTYDTETNTDSFLFIANKCVGTSVVTAQKSVQVKKRAIEIDIISEKKMLNIIQDLILLNFIIFF